MCKQTCHMILTLTSLLGKPFQQSLIHRGILWCKTAHRFTFCGQFYFAVLFMKRFSWSFLQRRTIDSLMPYSLAISELFSTASASATILSLNARLYDVRRAFGMIMDWQWTTINTGLFKTGLWTRNVHMIKPWIQFYSFDRITLNSA